jgi:hypothetical protein
MIAISTTLSTKENLKIGYNELRDPFFNNLMENFVGIMFSIKTKKLET